MVHNNPNVDLVNDNENTKFKIFNKNHNLTSIKGLNSVVNLPKMTLYNIDLVNDNVYTKFG